jgi:polyketide biosynthesis 3-hydroxy-3-methylglutaryl-CoA synthase-like enzyme PksG
MKVGIESIGLYLGAASLDANLLAEHRNLDIDRVIKNLIIREKSVALPFEDPVSNSVNAAKKITDKLSPEELSLIDMVITCSESGIDMAKSMSTYIHHYLGLNRNCRLFEVKNACYAGTAGLQIGINFVLSGASPGSKALVICTDIYRMFKHYRDEVGAAYYEPNTGAGAIAFLVGDNPEIIALDIGANGYYGYEVWDSSQPMVDYHYGNADLSLLTYMDAAEGSFREYVKRVDDADFGSSFDYLVYHTPFVGMVKGAHRTLMRKFAKAGPEQIEEDYKRRVEQGTEYCKRVGNIMGGSLYLALASLIDRGNFEKAKRVGLFSYGSGCASEFFSGIVTQRAQEIVRKENISGQLDGRYPLSFEEYEGLFEYNENLRFGLRDIKIQKDIISKAYDNVIGKGYLVLDRIGSDFHRKYSWT